MTDAAIPPPTALPVDRLPRVVPGDRADVGIRAWALSRALGAVSRTNPPNLFLTLGRHRRLFRGWLRFASRLMPRGRLPRRETELAILRVAHLRRCRYEFEHHVRIGRRSGVADADIRRVLAGADAGGWTPREAAILAAVDELHADGDLRDETWDRLRAHLVDEQELIELVMLVAHYEMLATTIVTLGIQPDRPVPRRAR
jgi:AhpD family alkylhydroperoxidase